MALNWTELQERFDELAKQLSDGYGLDQQTRVKVQKEASQISSLLDLHKQLLQVETQVSAIQQEIAQTHDVEMNALWQEELAQLEQQKKALQNELDQILYPPDELDKSSAFIEIRSGTGGAEAALFAADLMKMYTNYALKKNWRVSVVDLSETDLGGIREVVLHIDGKNVYQHFKREAGVHRVQRVPKTETQGRVHTSTATVAVLPEVNQEQDITINPQDLRIDTYRSGGAGGQHVNKTDSAVRITHLPTNIVVACQQERSQHKNRAKAMKMLQSRLLVAQREKQEAELSKERKKMVGSGMRSEKVRTYNYPQNRITDHQAGVTLKKLDVVMQGDLDDIVIPLIELERSERRARQEASVG